MDNNKFLEIYKSLGISIKPLPPNYSPDDYGKMLCFLNLFKPNNVYYSDSTDYIMKSDSKTKKEA